MAWTQGRGVVKVGGTDYSTEITEVTFEFNKELVEIPVTFGTDEADADFGATSRSITFTFFTQFAAASFHEALRAAFEGTGEATFDILMEGAVVGANNPRRTGTIVINSLETSGEVGSLRQQSQTYRIKAGTYVKGIV